MIDIVQRVKLIKLRLCLVNAVPLSLNRRSSASLLAVLPSFLPLNDAVDLHIASCFWISKLAMTVSCHLMLLSVGYTR